MAEFFQVEGGEMLANGGIPVTKFVSKKTPLTVYFADLDSQVVNGYFCFGIDQPEGSGIETLLWHLDSSGGLLPRPMRGEMLRPAWQFHGAENPLADRDQSCYVCSALGETAFLGTFSCCVYLLQNIEAVFEIHGFQSPHVLKAHAEHPIQNPDGPVDQVEGGEDDLDPEEAVRNSEAPQPQITPDQIYCLSEAGEGAMAWEATLQAMFPGVRAFYNRLLCDAKSKLSMKMRDCYDRLYRPENLTVVVTGTVKEREHVLAVLHEFEEDYFEAHPHTPDFSRPWTCPLPPLQPPVETSVRFVPKSQGRTRAATVCFGWRGCASSDWEKAMALKTLTAYLAVGPLWDKFVAKGEAHRISWCQLEYADTCSLITVHGVKSDEAVARIAAETPTIIEALAATTCGGGGEGGLILSEIRNMADRVGWHYVREMESEPFLVLASAISKAERYCSGQKEQVEQRIQPRTVFQKLIEKPLAYWVDLLKTFFIDQGTFLTKVLPKDYGKGVPEVNTCDSGPAQSEVSSGDMNFVAGSKRASTRPRRKANNPVAEESNVAVEEDGRNNNLGLDKTDNGGSVNKPSSKEDGQSQDYKEGQLEEVVKRRPFPFGNHTEEIADFENRLAMTSEFLGQVSNSEFTCMQVSSYESGKEDQHPSFPLKDLPFYTYLEDMECSFIYMTMVIDTSHLDATQRRLVAPVTAALGAIVCPRPPGLDTDADIVDPNEFNPPTTITDSQVSLGLNGEMMQSIFITLIVRPHQYSWAVGMFHHLLHNTQFSSAFLRFVSTEAARGLAANYRMQTSEEPNYECFEASEINLHALVKLIYKEESNARLFVGRRRLDLINEFLADFEKDEEGWTRKTNEVWRTVVDSGKIVMQIAGKVDEIVGQQQVISGGGGGSSSGGEDLVSPWKIFTTPIKQTTEHNFSGAPLTMESDLMKSPGSPGIVLSVSHPRPSCLSIAIPINPNDKNFPKLCLTAQLFSMAQKWAWACLDEDDSPTPVLRMPCSYANLLTLNLESNDVMGALEAMKMMMKEDWPWLESLLIATKLMVVNDPAALELGVQGAVACSLLAHLNNQELMTRRDLLIESLKVTVDDVRFVIREYLSKLFDPDASWYTLVSYGPDKDKLVERLEQCGFKFQQENLTEICINL